MANHHFANIFQYINIDYYQNIDNILIIIIY